MAMLNNQRVPLKFKALIDSSDHCLDQEGSISTKAIGYPKPSDKQIPICYRWLSLYHLVI